MALLYAPESIQTRESASDLLDNPLRVVSTWIAMLACSCMLHRTSTRSSGGIVSLFPADCPLDASLVPILAYLLMNGDEGARGQLRREMAAAGEQMGNTALEGRQHLYYFVIGGGNVVAFGDYLRTYLSILKKNPRGLGQYRGGVGLSGGQAW